jgi:uncharacterized Ntn-hydrolase superfamily protein
VTFSIVGYSADDGHGEPSWGVAVASRFLAVGSAVPAARAGLGAVATQAMANVAWKQAALDLLRGGASADEVVARLTAGDEHLEHRQFGVVDARGRAASHTGAECLDWSGSRTAPGVAVQGNILTGPEVVDDALAAFQDSAGQPLAHRLLAALTAGDAAGGDRRGRQSAALLVVRAGAGYVGLDDVAADLRVDDSSAPVPELARLLDLNDFYLSAPDDADRVPVTPDLAAEIDGLARARGHHDVMAWVGTENWEMRVAEAGSWIDRRVLALMRQG